MCYTYDDLNHVTSRAVKSLADNSVISAETYAYDAAGNMIGGSADTTFVYDTNNRLTNYNGNAVSYDMDGNMLHDGICSYTYDSANRLASFGGHAYTYTSADIRIRNLCAEEDTTYTYNTNCKLAQLLTKTTNGTVTKYVYGRGLIGEEGNSAFKTYHFDFRGSTVAITDANGNITDTFAYDTYGKLTGRTGTSDVTFLYNGRDGVITDKNGLYYMRARYYSPEMKRFVNADIVAQYSYDAWGVCTVTQDDSDCQIATVNPFRYRGYYYDEEIGLYYLQSRYYDAVVGRFIKSDIPEMMLLQIKSATGTNLYTYCNNNQVNGSDPMGVLDAAGVANWLSAYSIFLMFEESLYVAFSTALAKIGVYVTSILTPKVAAVFWWQPWVIVGIIVAAVAIVIAAVAVYRNSQLDKIKGKISNKIKTKSGKIDFGKFSKKPGSGPPRWIGPLVYELVKDMAEHKGPAYQLFKAGVRIATIALDGTIIGK